MRILFVSYTYWPPDFGGELLITKERFIELVNRGYRVTVLTSGKPGYMRIERESGLHILRSPVVHPSRTGRLLRRLVFFFWALWQLMRLKYDVVHLGSMPGLGTRTNALAGMVISRLAKWRGGKTVTVHSLADSSDSALEVHGLEGGVKIRFLQSIDSIVGVSPALYAPLGQLFPEQAVLLPCGVKDDLFTPLLPAHRLQIRREFDANANDIIFIFNGTLGHRKGFDVLASVFAELSANQPNWKLWVVGPKDPGENQNIDVVEVQAVLAPLENNRQVTYLGRINDRQRLAHLLGAGDIFVFPSRREGMGIAPVEAMSAGLPVIISRLPGVTDLANIEGVTGLYVKPGDINDLKRAMQQLGANAALRRQMGQAARQRVVRAFGWQQHVDQWAKLYQTGTLREVKQERVASITRS